MYQDIDNHSVNSCFYHFPVFDCCKQSLKPRLAFHPFIHQPRLFDCCKQSLTRLYHPSFHPSIHPPIHPPILPSSALLFCTKKERLAIYCMNLILFGHMAIDLITYSSNMGNLTFVHSTFLCWP